MGIKVLHVSDRQGNRVLFVGQMEGVLQSCMIHPNSVRFQTRLDRNPLKKLDSYLPAIRAFPGANLISYLRELFFFLRLGTRISGFDAA